MPVVLVLGAVVLAALVALMPKAREPEIPVETPPVNVSIQKITPLPQLADTFELTAVVEPFRVVEVAAEVAGRIERYGERAAAADWVGRTYPAGSKVKEGDPVAAGCPLVHLDRSILQAQYDRAAAQFEYDDREYRRHLDMYERNAASQTEVENARTKRDVSKATLEEARVQLERTTVAAPIGGVLNRLPAEIGEFVSVGDVVAEIVDIDTVKVVVQVPERDVTYMAEGKTAEVVVSGPDARQLEGEITYISELADPQTRTSRLEITVDNREHVLRSGQIVRARLTRRVLHDVIMIPLYAVIPLEHGKAVYVVDDAQKAQRREVELGLLKGRDVQILSGLAAGDRLIVAGHRYVGPGQAVAIIEER
jgi:membrane fusion protein (multidrug efflux system)